LTSDLAEGVVLSTVVEHGCKKNAPSSGCRGRDEREREKDDLLGEGEHEVVTAGLHERVGLRVGQPGGGLAIDRGDDFALANRLDGGLAAGIHLQPNGSI
jgi:hypothetical protein